MNGRKVEMFFDAVADIYDGHYQRPVDKAEDEAAALWLRRAGILRAQSVLDLGCGTGWLLQWFKPPAYVGIDVSIRMLEKARAKFPGADFKRVDMSDLSGLPRGGFDFVTATFGSLSYVEDRQAVARGIRAVLQREGRFAVMLYGKRYEGRRHHIVDGCFKFHLDDCLSARAIFTGSGLRVTGIQGINLLGELWPDVMWPESVTIGRLFPNPFYFLCVSGVRP